jgi:hypothetical protein
VVFSISRQRELKDGERDGHPKWTQTEVNNAAVADFVKNYHQIASRMIAEYLNIPKTVVLQILKKNLGKRKLRARCTIMSLPTKLQVFVNF